MRSTNIMRKVVLGAIAAALALAPGVASAQVIQQKTIRTEQTTQVGTGDRVLTGKVEMYREGEGSNLTIVDDNGARYFVEKDDNWNSLENLSGRRVKVHYFTPPESQNVVKVRSFEPLAADRDVKIEIDRDDNEVEVDVDTDE